MTEPLDRLVGDLKALRKGRGIHAPNLVRLASGALGQACAVLAEDEPARVRAKVRDRLRGLASLLQEDLRVAAFAAFALDEDFNQALYTDRLHLAGTRLKRDVRTVRRRVDEAIDRIAELALTPAGESEGSEAARIGWHTVSLRTLVVLDGPAPEVFEFRRIAADRDGLGEVDIAITKANDTEPPTQILHGGTLVHLPSESPRRPRLGLRMSERLDRGDEHEFVLRRRVSSHELMRPYFACTPENRCDHFDLRVRFDRGRLPRRVARISRAMQDDLLDPGYQGEPIQPDSVGDAHVSFDNLTLNRAYGLGWWWT
ncbi:hypothetical protein [Actinokineospora iranica]|uniref:Uncharacterized protein n=1 Tax=Actinokineospora iranica TaxID=1271860 RepID=A0A1G6LER9_9PSEU|nr:hypothetical protein [Actinokineospora iranica]SDC41704.1 hypothetical protein SAMN05216174_10233 [Actinokineospora iranica]